MELPKPPHIEHGKSQVADLFYLHLYYKRWSPEYLNLAHAVVEIEVSSSLQWITSVNLSNDEMVLCSICHFIRFLPDSFVPSKRTGGGWGRFSGPSANPANAPTKWSTSVAALP